MFKSIRPYIVIALLTLPACVTVKIEQEPLASMAVLPELPPQKKVQHTKLVQYTSDEIWLEPNPFSSNSVWPDPVLLSTATVWHGFLPLDTETALVEALPKNSVRLVAQSHVCNTEQEVARLARNKQLLEMARALVEFKSTQYCFILTPDAGVELLEKKPQYIKFKYKAQTLYTFIKYLIAEQPETNLFN